MAEVVPVWVEMAEVVPVWVAMAGWAPKEEQREVELTEVVPVWVEWAGWALKEEQREIAGAGSGMQRAALAWVGLAVWGRVRLTWSWGQKHWHQPRSWAALCIDVFGTVAYE